MGMEEFFQYVKGKCKTENDYPIELLKARGFLLDCEGDKIYLNDNSHIRDSEFLAKLLNKYNLGRVEEKEIILAQNADMELIFDTKRIGFEAFTKGNSWDELKYCYYDNKIPLDILEVFVARYVKALFSCHVYTGLSCDGNHDRMGGKIVVDAERPASRVWHKVICGRFIRAKFKLRWDKECIRVPFSEKTQWDRYISLNKAAEFLYDNRLLFNKIRCEAFAEISDDMIRNMSDDEIAAIFTELTNDLFDKYENEFVDDDIK